MRTIHVASGVVFFQHGLELRIQRL
eukprot:COSAG05_NODE_20976_length_275_cov_0.875000_1_plen_24_part_10